MNKINDYFFQRLVEYIDSDPVRHAKNIIKLFKLLRLFRQQMNKAEVIFEQLENKESNWYGFISNFRNEINENARKKIIGNLLLKGLLFPKKQREKLRRQQQVPYIVLLDPTSACNLHCLGCWSRDYDTTNSLSYELIDRIIREGNKLLVNTFIYSGGEPLLRRKDIIRLCREHPDCYFMVFTNGTLINDSFAAEVAQVGNLAPIISVEGFEEMTDFRRGKGTYGKVVHAMKTLKKYANFYGFSSTYHRLNTEEIGSNEFLDSMQELGCRFGWFFTYIPVGRDARPELIITPEQRASMYYRLREYRKRNPMFLLDFWNDGEFTKGCIAGGKQYLHINARGDIEPCAFIHYSNANIKDTSLKDALRQPLFEAYRKYQPFNSDHLLPCPCLDNPSMLRKIVHESKAVSTHLNGEETVEALTAKCEQHAAGWALTVNKIRGTTHNKSHVALHKPLGYRNQKSRRTPEIIK